MAKSRRTTPRAATSHLDFRRVALQRLEDAKTLLRAERTTGAVYLAGYAVECMLKAMVLSRLPASARWELLGQFKGRTGHSLEGLNERWIRAGGERFSQAVAHAFRMVTAWSTDYRYVPGVVEYRIANQFLKDCESVVRWAEGRVAHG
jgi:HEPN domain-containing protein